jgi:hypothetical protein
VVVGLSTGALYWMVYTTTLNEKKEMHSNGGAHHKMYKNKKIKRFQSLKVVELYYLHSIISGFSVKLFLLSVCTAN